MVTVALAFQWVLLKHVSLVQRFFGTMLVIAIALALLPPLLSWQKQREVPQRDQYLGWVLWDRSASFDNQHEAKEKLRQRLEQANIGNIEWIEFSEALLPPLGQGQIAGGTDLNKSLEQIAVAWEQQSPDWLWVVSDGGFEGLPIVPESLSQEKLFYSQINQDETSLDFGLTHMISDPVWYTRTESPLRVKVYRNTTKGSDVVDLMCRLDGAMVATSKAKFAAGESETIADFAVSSDRLGPVYVEVMFAEGQGGARKDNDHLLDSAEVIRDTVRVLRVVGRPTWSSKFLRDQLVKREDVDLIDFHILRSIHDRAMASTEELALIPFPVDELFVDNINSFDLVIWQNFDYENYPFFKPLYLRNIVKYVENGGSLLLWSGTQPWQLQTGILAELAPLANRGSTSQMFSGDFRIPETSLLPSSFKELLEPLSVPELRVFPGRMAEDTQVHLTYGDQPLMLSREFGRGRVLQMNTDEFWNVAFQGPGGANELYSKLLKHALLWLQHHTNVESHEIELPQRVLPGSSLNIKLPAQGDKTFLSWEGVSLEDSVQQSLDPEKNLQTVQVPNRPGVYELRLGQTGLPHRVGVGHPAGEYINPEVLKLKPERMKASGFSVLNLDSDLPKPKSCQLSMMRSTGQPWHSNWGYLAFVTLLLVCHWMFLNRSLKISV